MITSFYHLALAAFYIFWSDSGFKPCPESIDTTMFFEFCLWLLQYIKFGIRQADFSIGYISVLDLMFNKKRGRYLFRNLPRILISPYIPTELYLAEAP